MPTSKTLIKPFIAVTSLFFMWGFITVLADALIPRLKEVFELSYWQAATVQLAWFIPYGLLSIPAGGVLGRVGYKNGILFGLILAGIGCAMFYPAAAVRTFPLFLTAIFVLASGITILQVAANPYVTMLGTPESAARRLNLAQAFNSLGTTIAPIIASVWLLSDAIMTDAQQTALSNKELASYLAAEALAVQRPFLLLALAFIALAAVIFSVRLPLVLSHAGVSKARFVDAWRNSKLRFGSWVIFLYVGAEVAIGSFLALYFIDLGLPGRMRSSETLLSFISRVSELFSGTPVEQLDDKGLVGTFAVFYWGSAMVGRFFGAALLNVLKPWRVLAMFGTGAIAMILCSVFTSGYLAMSTMLLVGLFNSVMFPTVFSMSIDGLKHHKPEGSGILCTAIVGGAFIPPLVGLVRDATGSFAPAFIIPLFCYAAVIIFALRFRNMSAGS
jgi:FHS family L-fucose permease-like MFS transporter